MAEVDKEKTDEVRFRKGEAEVAAAFSLLRRVAVCSMVDGEVDEDKCKAALDCIEAALVAREEELGHQDADLIVATSIVDMACTGFAQIGIEKETVAECIEEAQRRTNVAWKAFEVLLSNSGTVICGEKAVPWAGYSVIKGAAKGRTMSVDEAIDALLTCPVRMVDDHQSREEILASYVRSNLIEVKGNMVTLLW